MEYKQIISDLKNKIYKPVYFLMGEEAYFIDRITNYIAENVLGESEKTFNQLVLYGKDIDCETIISTARRYPMMANYQVLIIKEAQHIKNIEDILIYVENPQKSTILVINYKYKKLDKRKKIYKAIEKAGVLFTSDKLYEAKVPAWINSYLSQKNCTITPNAAVLLTEFLGNDLGKIANELDKLIITLPNSQNTITNDHIEKNIGISKDFNNFELHKALTQKNILKANRIINYFGKNQKDNHISLTISSLYYFYSKILAYHFLKDKNTSLVASTLKVNPYFIKDYETAAKKYPPKKTVEIISLLREYDLKSKGFGNISASPGELLKELLFKILH